MEFFDKLGNIASETCKFTAEKTGKLAREAKLRKKMSDNKSKISEIYEQIGKDIYEKYLLNREEINKIAEIDKYCEEIDGYAKEIEECRKEILGLKDKKQCVKCNKEISYDSKFCPECGEEQPAQVVKEAEVVEDENEDIKEQADEVNDVKAEEEKEEPSNENE